MFIKRWLTVILLLGVLVGCSNVSGIATTPSPDTTATEAALPTLPQTAVPGSSDDEHDVTQTVRQFGNAVAQGNDTVALLVLSPSAQQIVAASDLATFLGEASQPQSIRVRRVHLHGDVAIAECVLRAADQEHPLQLQLVRLDGVWKIDAPVAVTPGGALRENHA